MNFTMTPSCGVSFNAAIPVANQSSAYLHSYSQMSLSSKISTDQLRARDCTAAWECKWHTLPRNTETLAAHCLS